MSKIAFNVVAGGSSEEEVGGSWFAEVVDYIEGPRSSPDMRYLNTHMLVLSKSKQSFCQRPGLSESCIVDIYGRL